MLCHHVFFWLKNPDSQSDKEKLIAGINSLRQISHVSKMHIGIPASTEKREVVDNSFSVTEIAFFESEKEEKAYQVDPIHAKFVEDHKHLWEKVLVYDSVDV